MNILFTGIGRRIELLQAFRNAALVLNKKIKIYGADMSGTAPALAFCDFTRKVVAMNDPNYIEDLLRICKDDGINILIPTIDTDLMILSENKSRFEQIGTRVLISDSDKISICRDKNNTSAFFVNCGLHAPLPVNNWKDYKSGFPAFIKPKDGSSSINAYRVENLKELEVYSRQIDDYVIQPFINGHEYTIDIFCDWNGNPISIVPRERLQVRAGEVLKTRILMDDNMIEEAKALCKAFQPCGPITVQLIRDENNIDWFIEINPRFGGGAPLSMKAGARSAEYIIKLMSDELIEKNIIIDDGAIYSRYDQSVCLKSNINNIRLKGVIYDLDDTLFSEKEYVKSGFKAISDYLNDNDAEKKMWDYFVLGKPAIDCYLNECGKQKLKDKCLDIYRNHIPLIHLYDGIYEEIKKHKEDGCKIGIITDGRPEGQRAKIVALGLNDIIDDIIITDELGGEQFRKPCDIAFRIMLTRWRLNPEEVIYIGDNVLKDFQACKQLGMKWEFRNNMDGLYC